ncbi:MAG: hypothetical protein L6R37_007698, partial [Teloschistes peruensis]
MSRLGPTNGNGREGSITPGRPMTATTGEKSQQQQQLLLSSPPAMKRKGSVSGEPTVDPLSIHILRRTGTEGTIPQKLRGDTSNDEEGAGGGGSGGQAGGGAVSDLVIERQRVEAQKKADLLNAPREKKKGVSFLSRFMGGGKKKNASDEDEGVEGDKRTEGIDAAVFSQPIGYIPQYPAPPKYIRVRSHHKQQRDFNNIFLAQELYKEPIYEDNGKAPTINSATMSVSSLAIPRHKSGAIWAMKFSKDGRYLAAGGQDKIVRVWAVIGSADERSAHEMDEDAAGVDSGSVYTEGRGVRLNAPVFRSEPTREYSGHTADILDLSWSKVKSSLGRNAKGSKITGIETITYPPEDPNGEVKVLITSNDSRVRMYNLRDKSLETKFKGNENTCSQIHATFSDDAKYIISGSEDRRVYIWNVSPEATDKKDKRPVEYFEAHPAIVTVAVLAPAKTRQLLGSSGDPIYDLCNPPPVTLVSRSDSVASSKRYPDTPTESISVTSSASTDRTLINNPPPPEPTSKTSLRALHSDGNIIVTADYTGRIKIFRQDCAYIKRKNDSWETSSTFSRRKVSASGLFNGSHGIRRSGSLNQGSPDRSWRNSVASDISVGGSLRGGKASIVMPTEGGYGGGGYSSRNRSVSPRKSMGALSLRSNGTGSGGVGGNTRLPTATPSNTTGRSRAQSDTNDGLKSNTHHNLPIRA